MLKRHGLKLLLSIILFNIFMSANAATTIPAQAWSRDINAGGHLDGAPIGGFGAGTISWRFDGNFYKQRLNIGAGDDGGATFIIDPVAKFYIYQKPASGVASMKKLDSSLGSNQAKYYSLFPKSWVDYTGSQFTVKSTVTQFSPIIPNDLTRTSYPVGIYEWDLSNPTAENVDVAIMLAWQNNDFSGANAQAATAGTYRGIVLRSGIANPLNNNQGEFCLGTDTSSGATVSYMSAAAIGTIETDFSADGILANTVGANQIGAIAFKVTLAPGANIKIPIVLSWDIPIAQPSSGSKWYRKYTRHWTRTGQNSWAIAQDALANHDSYESQIDAWQTGVLTNPNYPAWLKTMLFNELYIYFTGGTIWEAGAASGQQDNANEDMFSHLESYIYQFYGTSDVRFYGSWALFLNWPDIDKQCIRQFSDSVSTARADRPAAIGTCAHDFGDLTNVFQHWNAYVYRDSTTWKDLNSKFVLMVYRDYLLTGSTDAAFLNYCWNSVKVAMTKVKSQCAADGLPQSSGIDQTYDDMDLTGTTAYCGSLFLAACQAAKQIALAEGDNASATTYQSWFDLAQPNFESELWTGTYYKIDTGSTSPTRIMSDQLCGQWYSKALGLGGIVTDAHAQSAWQKVYDNNFSLFTGGANGVCNSMNAAGTIDTSTPQTQECWVGTSWGFLSGMVLQGMTTQANLVGQSLYNTIWNTAQYWFRTPEAWRTGVTSPRAFYYMRGSTIWGAKRAYDILMPVATATNTPNWTHTITPTNTPYVSPTITATVTPTSTVNPCITSLRRVNCGGPAATDSIGRAWSADQAYVAGGWGSVGATNETAVGNAIANTNDDVLYQTGAWGGTIGYSFTVANGPWRVVLRFAEINFNAANARKFSVFIEGQQVLTDLDVFVAAGNARYAAVDYTFDTTVSDGVLNITTTSSVDAAKFSAIEILDLSTQCSPTVTFTPLPGTATRTPTATQTRTATPTRTLTQTGTNTPYYSPTNTVTNTPYYSPTSTPTNTPYYSPTLTVTITSTATVNPCITSYRRINCGYTTASVTDSQGRTWAADQAYVAGGYGYFNAGGGTEIATANPIGDTADDVLYQTGRWGNGMEYRFTVPNGPWRVILRFAEINFTAAGQRAFNVSIEGTQVLTNFDVIAQCPAHAEYDAIDKSFDMTINDGVINIVFTNGTADQPKISAIEIIDLSTQCSPTATPTNVPGTATYTRTRTATPSATNTSTGTATRTATATVSATGSATPTWSASATASASASRTFTRTPSATASVSPSNTYTNTLTITPANTWTFTRTATATQTFTITITPTMTGTATLSATATASASGTFTNTPTYSLTATPTFTFSPSFTRTSTATYTGTPTRTGTPTGTCTPTFTISQTHTVSPTVTVTITGTPPTSTATPSVTESLTATPTGTATRTNTATMSGTPSATCTFTPSFTATASPTYTFTRTATATNSNTMTSTATQTNTPVNTATRTLTGTPTPVDTATDTPVNTSTALPSATATPSLTGTSTPLSFTPTPTWTITLTPVMTPTLAVYEILDQVVFPDPYNPAAGNFSARVNLTHQTDKLVIKVYTVSFRKVIEAADSPGSYSGVHAVNVSSAYFEKLSSGTYYYRIEGESTTGEKAASIADKFVILR